jgi:flagellar biosynthesis protein FlhG
VLAANLAVALSRLGHETVLVDLDLGASNQHSMLGLHNRNQGIGYFLKSRGVPLASLLVPTQWPRLSLLPGESRTPFAANLTFAHKAKLLKELRQLKARYVLLDLGAGSSYNTLDFFRVSPHGLVVTTSEKTALMNLQAFIKQLYLRVIERSQRKNQAVLQLIQSSYANMGQSGNTDMLQLQRQIAGIDSQALERIQVLSQRLQPRVIMNMARHPDDLVNLRKAGRALENQLGLQLDYFGLVFFDDAVRVAINAGQPLIATDPDSVAARGIQRIADTICEQWQRGPDRSGPQLLTYAREFYQGMVEEES